VKGSTTGERAALVIGAGSGTGGAVAKRFAREGFVACVVRRTADKLAPLVAEIEVAGGSARPYGRDARKEEAMIALVDESCPHRGPVLDVARTAARRVDVRARSASLDGEMVMR